MDDGHSLPHHLGLDNKIRFVGTQDIYQILSMSKRDLLSIKTILI